MSVEYRMWDMLVCSYQIKGVKTMNKQTFGNMIATLRKERGMTQLPKKED